MLKFKKILALALTFLLLMTAMPLNVFAFSESRVYFESESETVIYDPDNMPCYERAALWSLRRTAFDGYFGNQLAGDTKDYYDSLVEYYVAGRNTGNFEYKFSDSLKSKYTF